jgi:hypothetical protein
MRHLIAGLTVLLFSAALASAQERKPVQLADYVSFCLALWADAPDIEAKASALGLQHTADHVTIGKSTVQVYGAGPGNQGVVAVTPMLLKAFISRSGLALAAEQFKPD